MECICGKCKSEKYNRGALPYYEYTVSDVQDRHRQKAGMFLYDDTGMVLLVQCWGEHWGPPKGTVEAGETHIECAIREVREETGLEIEKEAVETAPKLSVNNVVLYFVKLEYLYWSAENIDKGDDNDATSVGIFNPRCVEHTARQGSIQLNCVYKFGMKHYRRYFAHPPKNEYTEVIES